MKYPLKWSICYQGKPYIELYGKKKAYELMYKLSMHVNGLSVIPVKPEEHRRRKTDPTGNERG
jgi:hypothetical protein